MASRLMRFRYLLHKLEYSAAITWKNQQRSRIAGKHLASTLWNNIPGRLTYLHLNKGEEMAPTITENGVTLVRKLPTAHLNLVSVGDVVLLKDPENEDSHLIRRLAAIEGDNMVSTDENDEPFTLEKNKCWVVADNLNLKPKEAYDSRIFGPVQMTNIVGRAIYIMRTVVDHGPVLNSDNSRGRDLPVLEVELDVDEMAKSLRV